MTTDYILAEHALCFAAIRVPDAASPIYCLELEWCCQHTVRCRCSEKYHSHRTCCLVCVRESSNSASRVRACLVQRRLLAASSVPWRWLSCWSACRSRLLAWCVQWAKLTRTLSAASCWTRGADHKWLYCLCGVPLPSAVTNNCQRIGIWKLAQRSGARGAKEVGSVRGAVALLV